MRRVIILLCCFSMILFVGCARKTNTNDSENLYVEESIDDPAGDEEELVEESNDISEEQEYESDYSEAPLEETDELEILKISDSFIQKILNRGGWGDIICLLRNDNKYSLSGYAEYNQDMNYSSGGIDYIDGSYVSFGSQLEKAKNSHLSDEVNAYFSKIDYSGLFLEYGNIPKPLLQDGDEIIGYSSSGIPTIYLTNSFKHIGTTINWTIRDSIYDNNTNWKPLDHKFIPIETVSSPIKLRLEVASHKGFSFQISDANGNVVDNIFDLEYGENYTVFWYEGTKYNEISMPALCKCYGYDPGYAETISIDGELTKDGYAIFDLSEVPSGIYLLNWDCIIEIP